MNKQLEELVEQATINIGDEFHPIDFFDKEKFAELLVWECINILPEKVKIDDIYDANILVKCGTAIKEHFGV